MSRPRPLVIVPGIWNSGPEHWQSHWERRHPDARRIAPLSWSEPDPDDWVAAIDRAVTSCPEPPVLVAHSLGVLASAAWLAGHDDGSAAGAFLVAPPDPDDPLFPDEAAGFRAPSRAVRTPSVLVASDDDPYCSLDRAVSMGESLGAAVLRIGAFGHVNVASGVGDWPAGATLLDAFVSDL